MESKDTAGMPECYIISAKWTHKKDDWFCFWRPDSKGYTIFTDQAGIYEICKSTEVDTERAQGSIYVKRSVVDGLTKPLVYDAVEHAMLPNTSEVRLMLSIKLKELKAKYKTV
jgi:hypothetical protein